jgi:hypothetical protein
MVNLKKQIGVGLVFLVLLVNVPSAFATSESFGVAPSTFLTNPIVRNIEMQKGEHLQGSFTVGNLQSWENILGQELAYSVSVILTDPKGQTILNYANTKGASFNYTAFYSGIYTMKFSCSSDYVVPSSVPNPEITINYDVVPASIPTPLHLTPQNSTINAFLVIAGVASVGLVLVGLLYFREKKKSKLLFPA